MRKPAPAAAFSSGAPFASLPGDDALHIPLSANLIGEEEVEAAVQVIRSGRTTMGERCREFEAAFAKRVGARHAIFVNSGSSANLLALFAIANGQVRPTRCQKPFQRGAEVIVPAVTWSTTVAPIIQAGAVPVFVDSDPRTLQIKTEDLEAALSDKTFAVMPTHIMGNAVDMKSVMAFAERHNLWVIEDTCEALGTTYDGDVVGTIGDIGTYSFYFSHHITTIEGGMVVTQNDALAELLRCLRAHGWTRDLSNRAEIEAEYPLIDPRFLFVNTGFNLRPQEINAAIGLLQLEKLSAFNAERVRIAALWHDAFMPLIQRGEMGVMETTPGADIAPFAFTVICRDRDTRVALQSHLDARDIDTRPIVCGNMARQPMLATVEHRVVGELAGADAVMWQGLYWGLHPNMNDLETAYVIENVTEFFAK
jgi:CDP-6-deoxy-D-xylo-4-hexulose-3-dehydrase